MKTESLIAEELYLRLMMLGEEEGDAQYENNNRFTAVGMASGIRKETLRNAVMENKLQGRAPDPCREKEHGGYYAADHF